MATRRDRLPCWIFAPPWGAGLCLLALSVFGSIPARARDVVVIERPVRRAPPLNYRARVALVVGVSAYSRGGYGDLRGTVGDAEAVATTLALRFGFEVRLLTDRAPATSLPANVKAIRADPVDSAALIDQLGRLKAAIGPDDALLFYFAGHGGRRRDAIEGYVVCSPGGARDLVPLRELCRRLSDCRAHHTLVLLDCCFSGTALEPGSEVRALFDATPGREARRWAARWLSAGDPQDSITLVFRRPAFQMITAGRGDEAVDDLATVSAAYRSLAAAFGDEFRGHSPFTGLLLKALRGSWGRADGKLQATQLGYFMGDSLVNDPRIESRQLPRFATLAGEGDFVFLPAHDVLNPKLLSPLDLPGARYADLRESAIRALVAEILAPTPAGASAKAGYRIGLTRDLVPYLSRLLDDPQRIVRLRAGEGLADLAETFADGVPEYSQSLAKLESILNAADDPPLRREAARALGRLGAYASESTTAAYKLYVDGLRTEREREVRRVASLLGVPEENFTLPEDLRAKVAEVGVPSEPAPTASAREWLAYFDSRRKQFEALPSGSLEQAVRRHEQGKAYLERANRQFDTGDFGRARMSAAAAIGFEGMGRAEMAKALRAAHEPVLFPETREWDEAVGLVGRSSDHRLIWCSPITSQHDGRASSLGLSEDGGLLATGEVTGRVRVWRTATGELLRSLEGRGASVDCVAFNPGATILACGTSDNIVELWDLRSGEERAALRGHYGGITCLAFAPDGRHLASASNDKTVRLWDLESLDLAATMETGALQLFALAFSPDGRRLAAAGGPPGLIGLWEIPSGKRLTVTNGHRFAATGLAFSPDGRTLASGGFQDPIRTWKVPSLDPLSSFGPRDGSTMRLRYLPDGGDLLCVDAPVAEGAIRRRDAGTGRIVATLREPSDGLSDATISGDGRWMATTFHGQTVRLSKLASGGAIEDPPDPNDANGVAFSPDGRHLAAGGSGKLVRIWDVGSGSMVRTLSGHTGEVKGVAYSPDGRTLASCGGDNSVRIWEARTGRLLHTLLGHKGPSLVTTSVTYSPDGRRIASGGGDKTVRLWDATTGANTMTLLGHGDTVADVAFSPDGLRIASAGFDRTLRVWDATTGRVERVLSDHKSIVLSVAYSPNGRRVASADINGKVLVREAETGKLLRPLEGHTRRVTGMAFSPDGTRLVSAGAEGTFRIWEVETGRRLAAGTEHTGAVNDVAFAPDGRSLASSSDDGTLRLWAVAQPEPLTTRTAGLIGMAGGTGLGRWLAGPGAHKGGVRAAAYSPDGRAFATLNNDGTAQLWDVATGTLSAMIGGDRRDLTSMAFSPDGGSLAVAGKGILQVRSADDGRLLRALDPAPAGQLVDMAFIAESGALSTLDAGGVLRGWDPGSGKKLGATRIDKSVTYFSTYRSRDGRWLAHLTPGYRIALWDAATGRRVSELAGHDGQRVTSVAFSSDGREVASSSDDGTIRLWEAGPGRRIRVFRGHTQGVGRVAFLAGDRRLASAGWDNTVRLWETSRDLPVKTLGGHNNGHFEMVVSPDRTLLVSTTKDLDAPESTAQLRVWQASTGRLLGVLPGRNQYPSAIAFSPDGSTFVSAGGEDVELWETPSPVVLAPYLSFCRFEGLEVEWRSSVDRLGETLAVDHVNLPSQSYVRILRSGAGGAGESVALFRHYLRAGALSASAALLPEIATTSEFGRDSERLLEAILAMPPADLPRALILSGLAASSCPGQPAWLIARGTIQARLARPDQARLDLDEASKHPMSPRLEYRLARGYSICAGRFQQVEADSGKARVCTDAAIQRLDAAVRDGFTRASPLDFQDGDFAPVRSDPRFAEIVRRTDGPPGAG